MPHSSVHRCFQFGGAMLAASLLLGLSGCAMCCAPYDCDFGYTGGAWIRDNPSWGRVGSAFEPAGYKAVDDGQVTESPTEPTPAQDQPMDDPQPMPPADGPNPELESPLPPQTMPPETMPPNVTSAPRLRPIRNYLPQN